jgi:hypothetical protein
MIVSGGTGSVNTAGRISPAKNLRLDPTGKRKFLLIETKIKNSGIALAGEWVCALIELLPARKTLDLTGDGYVNG